MLDIDNAVTFRALCIRDLSLPAQTYGVKRSEFGSAHCSVLSREGGWLRVYRQLQK